VPAANVGVVFPHETLNATTANRRTANKPAGSVMAPLNRLGEYMQNPFT
jgi:hypothetical protein